MSDSYLEHLEELRNPNSNIDALEELVEIEVDDNV
jgi:hypothetical protein